MPSLPLPFNRLRSTLPGGRTRRLLLWASASGLFAALLLALGGFSVIKAPLSLTTRGVLNVAAVGLGGLLYAALEPIFRRVTADPVRGLWTLFLLGLGLILAYAGLRPLFGPVALDLTTALPADLASASAAAVAALLEGLFAAALWHTVRPLVLFRRTERTGRIWQALILLITAAALSFATTLPDEPPGTLSAVLTALAVVPMLYAAFRASWIVPLPFRRKLATMGIAAGLIGVFILVLVFRESGFAAAEADGGRIALATLFSRSFSEFVAFTLAFGILYASTTLLSLLFHLPTSGAYEQRSSEVKAFRALTELTGQVLDRDALASTVARAPVEAGAADVAWLTLIDPRTGSLAPRTVAASGLPPAAAERLADVAALTADVAQTRRPLVLGTAAADHRVRTRPGDRIGSLLVLPLVAGGQTHGALFAARAVTDGFEPEDVEALGAFAGQSALAFAHAALFAEALEHERLARELALAREVQQRLLPQHLPELEGVEVAASEQPAREVCGDYYDLVDLGEGRLGVLVADVAGKGAAAAFYMAELKGVVQSTARLSASPGELLARANEALAPSLGKKAFISAVYGVLDTHAGTFTVARAGHCPVAMARGDGGAWLLRADGLGLGLDDGPLFRKTLREQVVRLRPGDVFALYTDGLVEARNAEGEEYGYDRLSQAVAAHRDATADEILAALLAEQRSFTGPEALDDDLTLVVLRWTGPPAGADRKSVV